MTREAEVFGAHGPDLDPEQGPDSDPELMSELMPEPMPAPVPFMPVAGTEQMGAELVVTSDQSDLATARQTTADYLRDRCDWVDRDAVLLVVSELLSNAVLHGGGWWRLVVAATPWRLRVEVEDRESSVPAIRQANSNGAPGGMGMHIVTRIVSSYEAVVKPAGAGKAVRALWIRPASSGSRTPPGGDPG